MLRQVFSAVSLIVIAFKLGVGKLEFDVDLGKMRSDLLDNEFSEVPIESAFVLRSLAPIHKDPFDRLLVAQAKADGLILLSVDRRLADYGPMVELLR